MNHDGYSPDHGSCCCTTTSQQLTREREDHALTALKLKTAEAELGDALRDLELCRAALNAVKAVVSLVNMP